MQDLIKLSSMKYNGIYRGIVVDTDDTLKLGRVKIKVLPMMNDIQVMLGEVKDALPWAVPAMPLSEGAGAGFGTFTVPQIDAMVWCFFENGDFMQPVYFAEAQTKVHGMPAWRTVNYPDRKGVEFKNGMRMWMDEHDDVVYIEHPSGNYYKIYGKGADYGQIEMVGKDDFLATIEKTALIEVKGYVEFDTPVLTAVHNLEAGTGATGTFTSLDGKVVTVMSGIIVGIT